MTQKLLTLPFRLGFGAARTALDVSAKTLEVSTRLAGTALHILRPGGGPDTPEHPNPEQSKSTKPKSTKPKSDQPKSTKPRSTRPTPGQPTQPSPDQPTSDQPQSASEATASKPASPRRRSAEPSRVNGHAADTAPPAAEEPSAPLSPAEPPAPSTPITPPDEQPDTPLTHEQEVVKTLEDEEEVVAEFAEPGAEDGAGAQLHVDEPWEGYTQMNASAVIARIDQAGAAELALLELYEQTHRKRQTVLAAATRRLRALSAPGATSESEVE